MDAPTLDWQTLSLEQTGRKDTGQCDCCGKESRSIWGFIQSPTETLAAYFVYWTVATPIHGENFDLIVGRWREGTTPQDRKAISLAYRIVDSQPSFMIIDASTRPIAGSDLISGALSREALLASPLKSRIFAMVDAIYFKDPRMSEIRGWRESI